MNIYTTCNNAITADYKIPYVGGGDLEINVLRYGNWMIEGRSDLSSWA